MEYRPLEGFVLAITPFNFTAIAGNLPTAPALLGNVVVWKPSPTQQLAAHYTMALLEAAGLPPGVINMVTGDGQAVSRVALSHPDLAGIHFTGSTGTFQHLWRAVGENIQHFRDYPRARRRDRRQGLRDRPPVGRPRLDRDHAGPRRLRVPGAEVLRRVPRLPPRLAVGWGQGRAHRHHAVDRLRRRVRGPVPLRRRGDRFPRGGQAPRRVRPGAVPLVGQLPGRRRDRRRDGLLRPADDPGVRRPGRRGVHHRVLRPDPRRARLRGRALRRHARPGRRRGAVRADRLDPRHRPRRDRRGSRASCATARAISTSTTSRPARWSASSRSAAPGPAAPTTRQARCSTSSAGSPPGPSRRRSSRPPTTVIRTWADSPGGDPPSLRRSCAPDGRNRYRTRARGIHRRTRFTGWCCGTST